MRGGMNAQLKSIDWVEFTIIGLLCLGCWTVVGPGCFAIGPGIGKCCM